MKRAARGFTLIELLVALAVFAVIATLTLRALAGSIDQRADIEAEGRKWRDLGRLFGALESDLAAMLSTPAAPVAGAAGPAGAGGEFLALARAGRDTRDATPLAPRGVVYRLNGTTVERTLVHSLARRHDGDTLVTTRFAPAVRSLALRYRSSRGDWLTEWHDAEGNVPRAVEVTIVLASNEQVRKLMLVR